MVGKPLTFLQARNNHDNAVRVEQWYLLAPPSGTGTVTRDPVRQREVVGRRGVLHRRGPGLPVPRPGLERLDRHRHRQSHGRGLQRRGRAGGQRRGHRRRRGPDAHPAGGAEPGVEARTTAPPAATWRAAASTTSGRPASSWAGPRASNAKWAIAAAAIKPAPSVALTQYQATFWAKRGQSRTLQINYAAGGGTSPFMKLTVSDPTYVPGRGNLAMGDSVLVTATVDPNALTRLARAPPAAVRHPVPAAALVRRRRRRPE